jgi:hypothetical protein
MVLPAGAPQTGSQQVRTPPTGMQQGLVADAPAQGNGMAQDAPTPAAAKDAPTPAAAKEAPTPAAAEAAAPGNVQEAREWIRQWRARCPPPAPALVSMKLLVRYECECLAHESVC